MKALSLRFLGVALELSKDTNQRLHWCDSVRISTDSLELVGVMNHK